MRVCIYIYIERERDIVICCYMHIFLYMSYVFT